MQPDQELINRWSRSAPFWEQHRDAIRHMFAPITQALVEDAQIGSGQSVLDVGTGPGEPALSLAHVVGPEGKIAGVDPIPEMVAAARREVDHLGIKNVKFEVAFADRLPFPADTFDAAVSRLGAMFFPSPIDAVREILRVLKPGRKLAQAVWHFADTNPFHFVLSRVIDRYAAPQPAPDAWDAFRFAPAGKLRDVLFEAGAMAPLERLLRFTIHAPMSVEDFWTLRLGMSGKLREKVATLPPPKVAEVQREVLAALGEYSTGQGLSFPAEVLLVSGMKSISA